MNTLKYRRPKGTRDIIPEEYELREVLLAKIKKSIRAYGYKFIITPTFEHTELFIRSIGDSTDIVEKEMYTFQDKKGRSYTLRPEGTAPVIRAFLENSIMPPAKLAYIMNMFRAERPQKGRYREFWQVGVEAIGIKDPLIDAEVIEMGYSILKELGAEKLVVLINSIGSIEERQAYKSALLDYLNEKEQEGTLELCNDCKRRKSRNPLRILDCKIDGPKLKDAPKLKEFLSSESLKYFEEIKTYLDKWKVNYREDPTLVRGLDYYNHTAFEIVSEKIGVEDTLLGGGRYDSLVEDLGGPATPAIGWAFGLERIINYFYQIPRIPGPFYFVATVNEFSKGYAIGLLKKIREWKIPSDMTYEPKSLKAQMKIADRLNAVKAVIVGEDEIKAQKVRVRDLETGKEILVPEKELIRIYEEEMAKRKGKGIL